MSLSEKQRKFTIMVGNFLFWAHAQGYELTFGHAWRDEETQARMVEKGASKTMNSKHRDRLAVDFNLFINGKYITDKEAYRPLGEYWESIAPGNKWGGRFGVKKEDYATKIGWDAGHFQYDG